MIRGHMMKTKIDIVGSGMLLEAMQLWASKWKVYSEPEKTTCKRMYYQVCFDMPISTGLISCNAYEKKLHNKSFKPTKDHFTVPQFCAGIILNHPDVFLANDDVFLNMFTFNCGVIEVTKEENDLLKKYTNKDYVLCSALDRYKKENIELYHKQGGLFSIEEAFEILDPPSEYFELEKEYIRS